MNTHLCVYISVEFQKFVLSHLEQCTCLCYGQQHLARHLHHASSFVLVYLCSLSTHVHSFIQPIGIKMLLNLLTDLQSAVLPPPSLSLYFLLLPPPAPLSPPHFLPPLSSLPPTLLPLSFPPPPPTAFYFSFSTCFIFSSSSSFNLLSFLLPPPFSTLSPFPPFPSSYSCTSLCFHNTGSASQAAGTLPSRMANASRSHLLSAATLETSVGGGLSVTACLNDFSLYIFHPYGGGQKKASLSVLENTFRKGMKGMAGNQIYEW